MRFGLGWLGLRWCQSGNGCDHEHEDVEIERHHDVDPAPRACKAASVKRVNCSPKTMSDMRQDAKSKPVARERLPEILAVELPTAYDFGKF